jgi:hypothetical protein
MRRSALKSDLFTSIGWSEGNLQVRYREDGAIFTYFDVPVTTYVSLMKSKTPGSDWMKVRDKFDYRED